MTALLTWRDILVALLAAALIVPWLCDRLERRADRRDARVWDGQPGAAGSRGRR